MIRSVDEMIVRIEYTQEHLRDTYPGSVGKDGVREADFQAVISDAVRPYFMITEQQYDAIMRESMLRGGDVFLIDGFRFTTGTADGGHVLMPLGEPYEPVPVVALWNEQEDGVNYGWYWTTDKRGCVPRVENGGRTSVGAWSGFGYDSPDKALNRLHARHPDTRTGDIVPVRIDHGEQLPKLVEDLTRMVEALQQCDTITILGWNKNPAWVDLMADEDANVSFTISSGGGHVLAHYKTSEIVSMTPSGKGMNVYTTSGNLLFNGYMNQEADLWADRGQAKEAEVIKGTDDEPQLIKAEFKDWQDDVDDRYKAEVEVTGTNVGVRVTDERGNAYDVVIEAKNGNVRVSSYVADGLGEGTFIDAPVSVTSMGPGVALIEVDSPGGVAHQEVYILADHNTGELSYENRDHAIELLESPLSESFPVPEQESLRPE